MHLPLLLSNIFALFAVSTDSIIWNLFLFYHVVDISLIILISLQSCSIHFEKKTNFFHIDSLYKVENNFNYFLVSSSMQIYWGIRAERMKKRRKKKMKNERKKWNAKDNKNQHTENKDQTHHQCKSVNERITYLPQKHCFLMFFIHRNKKIPPNHIK